MGVRRARVVWRKVRASAIIATMEEVQRTLSEDRGDERRGEGMKCNEVVDVGEARALFLALLHWAIGLLGVGEETGGTVRPCPKE